MIVQCEQCHTKFRIPDDKVTDKGVKVRCTKCQHTFRVKRVGDQAQVEGSGPSAATAPAAPAWKPDAAVTEPRASAARVQPTSQDTLRSEAAGAPRQFDFDPSQLFGAELPPAPAFDRPPPPSRTPEPASDDPFALDAPAPVPPTAKMPAAPPPPPPPEPSPASFGQSSVSLDHVFDDPMADVPPLDDLGQEPDRALFDMPSPPPAGSNRRGNDLESSVTISQPLARLALKQIAVPVERPAGRPEEMGMEEAPPPQSVARRATGLVVNLAIATVLMLGIATAGSVYLSEGKVGWSSLSLDRLKGLWARSDLVAVDVSNGLYETRAGRPIFFVRGEVSNRGHRTARVKVHTDILDGVQVLQSAEALAGATPTPEDLFGLSNPQDAVALGSRVDEGAVAVGPGKRAPFLVTFFDYPPDLAGLRLRVTVQEASGPTAAR
jgi:predicted Zn finger-like uncharacterized protein